MVDVVIVTSVVCSQAFTVDIARKYVYKQTQKHTDTHSDLRLHLFLYQYVQIVISDQYFPFQPNTTGSFSPLSRLYLLSNREKPGSHCPRHVCLLARCSLYNHFPNPFHPWAPDTRAPFPIQNLQPQVNDLTWACLWLFDHIRKNGNN